MFVVRLVGAALASRVGAAAPRALPASIRAIEPVVRSRDIWRELVSFFVDGPSDRFRVAVDATCASNLEEPWTWKHKDEGKGGDVLARLPRPTATYSLTHPKWSTEVWLPAVLARSRWAAREGEVANATVVAFSSRREPRHALSWCHAKLAAQASPRWRRRGGTDHWFVAISSRGPCCDGGQARDPGLLAQHFFVHGGEERDGPWLFREARFADAMKRASQYKAPVTRDTAPRVRCFDETKDVALPPPTFLLRKKTWPSLPSTTTVGATEDEGVAKCVRSQGRDAGSCYLSKHRYEAAAAKDVLVMHAEGRQGGPEYHLRRGVTEAWAPPARGGKTNRTTTSSREAADVNVVIAKTMALAEYVGTMRRARYCVVSEGYSPWSPRLTEAVAQGCVPALLSPSFRPPYASVLDWSLFSVRLDPGDLARLPEVLGQYDHAALHANLMRVRPLFAFCVDEGGEDGCGGTAGALPGDGLPLVVFEMARSRQTTPAAPRSGVSNLLAADPGAGDAATHTQVAYDCHLHSGRCEYTVRNETWRCGMVNRLHCECAKKITVPYTKKNGSWSLVGSTANLVGSQKHLWAPPRPRQWRRGPRG